MHERFSDRTRHAMALANLEAGKLNHDYLAPAHLLLGLIAEGNCVATETMRLLKVNLHTVRDKVRAQLETGPAKSSVGRRAHTRQTKEIIEKAIAEARKFGHPYIGTEHLLMALLQQTDEIPAKVLREQGLELDRLREKALAILRSDTDASSDLTHSRHGDFEWMHQQELAKAFRSPAFWHTMILAVDSANRLGAGELEPVHLLLGLLRDSKSGIADLLAEKEVTADWLRERIANLNSAPEPQ
jgi:ATP-dependent Clp protease ATP-binding subunit ClpA